MIINLKAIPEKYKDLILGLGEIGWGVTEEKTDEEHIENFKATLLLTSEHFGLRDKTKMHGIYLKDTGSVIAKTGNSPNSEFTTPVFVWLWNTLHMNLVKTMK